MQNGWTPLFITALNNNSDCMDMLLRHDADVDIVSTVSYIGIYLLKFIFLAIEDVIVKRL